MLCPDLTGDDFVNLADFEKLAENWMHTGAGLAGDFDESGDVNINDLVYMSGYWLQDPLCPEPYTAVGWGWNEYGQCDVPEGNDFEAIAAGKWHGVALKTDGSIVAWGDDYFGQLQGIPTGNDFIAIAAGGAHSLALRDNGTIEAWGRDNLYQVSDKPTGNGFLAIAAGEWHNLAIKSDGTIIGWGGHNDHGELNAPAPDSGTVYSAVAAGRYHSLALQSDGTIKAWGSNDDGQTRIYDGAGSDHEAIAACEFYNFLLTENDTLITWGGGDWLEPGIPDYHYRQPDGTDFVDIAAGYYHILALTSEGEILSWGWDDFDLPTYDPPGGNVYTDISAGLNYSLALSRIVEIRNPENPNKGLDDDSDDFFFRGPSEPDVMIYYDLLPPSEITPTSVKLLIKEGGSILCEINLPTDTGENLTAQWDGRDENGDYYGKWDFRAAIQVEIDGQTITSSEHPVADILYKHRPLVYVHEDETNGPQDVVIMMDHADLYDRVTGFDEKVASEPLDFSDLSGGHDTTEFYQNLDDNYRQTNEGDNIIYCRGTTFSGHAFLQYWHFEPSSSIPETTGVWHEGDWEMFQMAVELDTEAQELKPFAVTSSQHYYGQTICWEQIKPEHKGPESIDQDYVGKSGHRPQVYVARDSHATYFRSGSIRVDSWPPGSTANSGTQYEVSPTAIYLDDYTGTHEEYSYTLKTFHNSMISHWQGRWGEDALILPADGPRSPAYRETEYNVWFTPVALHNHYLKRLSYDEGAPEDNWAHSEIEIK